MSNTDYLDVGPEHAIGYEMHRSNSVSSSTSSEYIPTRRSSERSTKNVSSFISKLYSLVNDTRYQDLISWNPAGTSFLICNVKKFAQKVLPEYFKHGNFSSFVRLLNMYGFHKINKSPRGQRGNENEIWEFSHPQFQQNRPDLLKEIRRKAMDSEVLRRETGDIHSFFSMLQVSQADLQRQFQALQTSFSNLLQGFEETRKMQLQQQFLLKQLADRQGVRIDDLLPGHGTMTMHPTTTTTTTTTIAPTTAIPPDQPPVTIAPAPVAAGAFATGTPDVFITGPSMVPIHHEVAPPMRASSSGGGMAVRTPGPHDVWSEHDPWDTCSSDMLLSVASKTPLPPSPTPSVDPNRIMLSPSASPMMS
ncbi:HSF-type DNA-binding-domain-containing protein [Dichotomocladium elegans]|nr:HSF-type DNA-binding-domain-containing protein [Dichotomocladium elegans]